MFIRDGTERNIEVRGQSFSVFIYLPTQKQKKLKKIIRFVGPREIVTWPVFLQSEKIFELNGITNFELSPSFTLLMLISYLIHGKELDEQRESEKGGEGY